MRVDIAQANDRRQKPSPFAMARPNQEEWRDIDYSPAYAMARVTLDQGAEHQFGLHARKRRTQAKVGPGCKRERRGLIARSVAHARLRARLAAGEQT